MATPRLGLVVEDKPTELSCKCTSSNRRIFPYLRCSLTELNVVNAGSRFSVAHGHTNQISLGACARRQASTCELG